MDISDQELVSNYLNGDSKSLEILIHRYLKPVYRFVYRYAGSPQDAEDITQETFVKVWRNLKKFDQQKSFKTWVFAIAKNTAIDFLKKKRAVPFSALEDESRTYSFADTVADSLPLPDEMLVRRDTRHVFARAMEKLSLPYRAVLSLRLVGDLTFREIAESLGEPLYTVKSRYRRGLILLKNIFQAEI